MPGEVRRVLTDRSDRRFDRLPEKDIRRRGHSPRPRARVVRGKDERVRVRTQAAPSPPTPQQSQPTRWAVQDVGLDRDTPTLAHRFGEPEVELERLLAVAPGHVAHSDARDDLRRPQQQVLRQREHGRCHQLPVVRQVHPRDGLRDHPQPQGVDPAHLAVVQLLELLDELAQHRRVRLRHPHRARGEAEVDPHVGQHLVHRRRAPAQLDHPPAQKARYRLVGGLLCAVAPPLAVHYVLRRAPHARHGALLELQALLRLGLEGLRQRDVRGHREGPRRCCWALGPAARRGRSSAR